MDQTQKSLRGHASDYFVSSEERLRQAIDDISDQLGAAVDGRFEFTIRASIADETLDKLAMLINFVIEAARRSMHELEAQNTRLAELDRMKSVFLANVSHELRTPLTLILGPAEKLLSETKLKASHRECLDVIRRNARLLLRHVNDILDIAKLESNKLELEYRQADLADLIRLTASHFDVLAHQKNLNFEILAGEPVWAQVDTEKLQRVILNLLSNAFKFTPVDGRIYCALSIKGEMARIEVGDSGPGIEPELRDVIFERFEQGERGSARMHGGTGLGLAIAKEFTEMHAGRISVSRSEAGGALFAVEIPLHAPLGLRIEAAESRANLSNTALDAVEEVRVLPVQSCRYAFDSSRATALVVEDNPQMRQFIVESLANDFNVLTATDGQQGLEKALSSNPDLIVTDIMMPKMSGDQMIAHIRRHAELDKIPVLVLSAKADNSLAVELLKNGVQDYVVKPFAAAEVLARAKNLAAMKRAADMLRKEMIDHHGNLEQLSREVVLRKRQLENALGVRDEFLSIASHELKTPITSLKLQLQMSNLDHGQNPELREAFDMTLRQVDYLTNLVDALLDVSRIQTGQFQVHIGEVKLADLILETAGRFQSQLQQAGIQLQLNLESGTTVYCDRYRIQQVVANMISNAIKYAPGAPLSIDLVDGRSSVEFRIRDAGPGIPAEKQALLFERFERASSGGGATGLGLGLFISRRIVEAHKGSIDLQSEKNMGAQFTIRLPKNQKSAEVGK